MAVFGHDEDGFGLYGDLVRCKCCSAVFFGTLFPFHDHWHEGHSGEVGWQEFLESFL
jgi:hypothetical protein